jgi:hypothetical protein
MKRKWQDVAERADNRTFGIDEVSNAMIPALAGDCRDEMSSGFIEQIRGVCEEQESLLIKDDIRARMEALRPEAGTGIGRRLIENVVRISSADAADVIALAKAMTAALAERAARCNRQVEEHYLRQSSASRANNVRGRLEQATAGAALEALARQILKLDNIRPARSSAKRDGLDEGPSIR